MRHHPTHTAPPRMARWRRLRRLARDYDRGRFLAAARADLLGREIAALAEAAADCAAEPAYTRILIGALRRRRRALMRAAPGGLLGRGPLPDALAVAILAETAILRRQRLARAQADALAHLGARLGGASAPAGSVRQPRR